ncbi:MAG: hypothetical protein IT319_10170 [Anaerolineae bacterium]|nr:hypothetical protein [Anaerolineae bacterium]
MGQYKVVIEQRSRRRWAAYGFLLIVALLIIAWFLAPTAISAVRSVTKGRFPPAGAGLTAQQLQLIFTFVLFLLMALIAALIVTLAAPRKALNVSEKELVKERDENEKYKRMARKRQRTLNREMREFVEKNQQK